MPRLAIAFEFPTLSGGERSMLAVLSEDVPDGWDVVAIAPKSGPLADELRTLGVVVCPFDLRESGNKPPPEWAAKILGEVVETIQPDVVHANSLSMSRVTGRLMSNRRERGSGVVATGHLRDIMKLSKAAVADVNSNQQLLCVSEATRLAHVAQGLNPQIASVVYNGVKAPVRSRGAGWLHEELAIPVSTPLIATVGQICLRKGHDIAAAALAQLGERDWRWLIIGERFSQKPESEEFDRMIESILGASGLAHRVVRLGFRHDMADIYPEITLLLHAARQEPFGRVLLEAGACSTPVVATDAGGTRELVGPEFPLSPVDDVDTMAALIASALESPQEHTFSVDRFTTEACATQCWERWQSAYRLATNGS